MALDLPPELQPVLGLLGVEWPQANEDEIVRLADELSRFASSIDSVQMVADKAVGTLREAYHGASADQFADVWTAVSKFSHLVVEACGTLGNALHAGALAIQACKAAAAAQLVATQGELAVASLAGPGGTAAAVAAGKQILTGILEQAVSALGQALAKPVGDVVESVVKEVTGGGTIRSIGAGFGVDLSQLASCATALRGHADDIDTHGSSFRRVVEGLDLGNPADAFGQVVIAAAEQIATAIGVEVIKRLLGAFQGTADRLDQVGRTVTEHEDQHTQQLQSILAGQGTPVPSSPLKLEGGLHGLSGARSSGGERLSLAGLDSPLGQADAPAAPAPAAARATTDTPSPQWPGGLPGDPSLRRAHPGEAAVTGHHHGTDPAGRARPPVTPAPGSASPAGYRPGGGRPPGPAGTGQVRAAVLEQHRSALAARRSGPAEDGVDPHGGEPGPDSDRSSL